MKPRTIAQWEMDKQIGETDVVTRYRQAYIPAKFWNSTWDDYQLGTKNDADEQLKDVLLDYAKHWTPDERAGMVILGMAGWGKTFGTTLLAMDLIRQGAWCKQITYKQLSDRRKSLIGLEKQAEQTDDWGEFNAAAYRLMFIEQECEVLFLDDVGKEFRSASDWNSVELDDLLRKRVAAGKVTVMTSNTPRDEWARYNSSMVSFLYEVGELVELVEGQDYRVTEPEARKRRRGEG